MEQFDTRRVNVRGIIWQHDKLLAVKHKRSDGSEADYWAIPGGGLDPRESLQDGMQRELIEETGVTATVGKLLFLQQFSSERKNRSEELEFFFHIKNPEDFSAIDLAKTTHGGDEIARIEFIDPRQEHILPAFLSNIDIADYVAHDKPVYMYNKLSYQS